MKLSDLHPVSVIGLGCADLSQPSVWLPYRDLLAESDIICGGKSQLVALAKALPDLAPQDNGESCRCQKSNTPEAAKILLEPDSQKQPPNGTAQKSRRFLPIGAGFEALLDDLCQLREQGEKIVVLASGDPLFYGVGASLAARFGADGTKDRNGLVIYPAVSSMQEACARQALPWDDAIFVSLHGRDENIHALYNAVHGSRRPRPVCVLLDHKRSPAQLAAALLERGISAYTMHFFAGLKSRHAALKSPSAAGCECDNGAALYVSAPLAEAPKAMPANAPAPGLLILEPHRQVVAAPKSASSAQPAPQRLCLGMPDEAFTHRAGLITKQPIRAAVIAALRLFPEHTLFDIGAGCGSVGLEASSLLYAGRVFAVEQHAERVRHIEENRKKFGAANLEILHGDALSSLRELPQTDRIFIGGGLNMTVVSGADAVSCVASAADTTAASGATITPNTTALPDAHTASGTSGTLAQPSANALLSAAWGKLKPGGRLVLSCVLLGSLEAARRFFEGIGVTPELLSVQAASAAPLAGDLQLKSMNQVFIMSAWKQTSEQSCAGNK